MSFAPAGTASAAMSQVHDPAPLTPASEWRQRARTTLPVVVATVLLVAGLANIVQRASQDDVEDGVLWVQRSTGVVAAEVDSRSPAGKAGIRPGDVLLAVDGQPIEARDDVYALQIGRAHV